MRLVAYDPFVSRRAGPPDERRARRTSTSCWPSPTSSPSTWPRRPRPSGSSAPSCWPKAKPGHAHRQRGPRRHRRRGRRWPTPSRDGHVGGAALDVFAEEPTTESPLFGLDQVVVTPHLGASTGRGPGQGGRHHRRAGRAGPRRRLRALRRQRQRRPRRPRRCGRSCPWPSGSASCSPALGAGVGRRRSRSSTRASSPTTTPASSPCRCSRASSAGVSDEPVSYVNAPQLAEDRGIEVRETKTTHDPATTSTSSPCAGGGHAIAGTLVGPAGRAPHRDGRRPHRRRAAGRPHAGRPQRRPPGRDRPGRHGPRRGRRQHRRHGRRPVTRRARPP